MTEHQRVFQEAREHLWRFGWKVGWERPLGRWGRVDLLAFCDCDDAECLVFHLIEVKPSLTTASETRAAIQQAAGYGHWWDQNERTAYRAWLISDDVSDAALDLALEMSFVVETRRLEIFKHEMVFPVCDARRQRAAERLHRFERAADDQRQALEILNNRDLEHTFIGAMGETSAVTIFETFFGSMDG